MAGGDGRRYIRRLQRKIRPVKQGVMVEYSIFDYDLVYFTCHALDRMKERGVRRSQVFDVLEEPTKKGLPTQTDRERWRKNISKHDAIDVVFERWPTKVVIVTVMVLDL